MIKKVTNFVLNTLHKRFHTLNRTNEGGSTIRRTRIKKFRSKGKKLLIAAKLVAVWYLLILTGTYLSSDTGAYFNDVEVIENSLHAKWEYLPDDGIWGKSSLKEVSISGSCKEGIIARFTNDGESVSHELTTYEVYWSKTANPKDGEIIKTGTFPIPNKGEFYDIYYKPLKDGRYNIKAYQETGHGNGNADGKGPWSGEIAITGCSASSSIGEGDSKPSQPPVISQPLGEVKDLSWDIKDNSGQVTVSWKNPESTEFSHVNVYIEGQTEPRWGNKKDQLLELGVEDTATPTMYRITTVDKSGKESVGIKITVSKDNVIKN